MLAINSPIQQYFDLDGSPLNAGYLYFGTAFQNPEISPVTVYWDAAGTQPAAQPVRTLNGYAVRNGTPAVLFAAADFSETVKTKKGELVLYAPNSADYNNSSSVQAQVTALIAALAASSGSSTIGFLQAGTGAVARTLQSKVREIVSATDFGIVNDGNAIAVTGTNNSAAFTTAITACLARRLTGGIPALFVPDGTYGVQTRLQLPSGTRLQGAGALATQIFPLSGFNDAAGVINTVESGFGQPPGGLFDIGVSGNFLVSGTTPGVLLSANASSCERVWIGGFAFTHLKCASTNQIVSRVVIDNALATANSVGIEVVSPGVQLDTCTVYSNETGYSIHSLSTVVGRTPVQMIDCYTVNPIGSGYGIIISTTNGMPVLVTNYAAMSDLTTGYAGGGVKLVDAPNVHLSQCRVEFPSACTQSQIGFDVTGTSPDVTLVNCSTKFCNIGMALEASSAFVNGGVHLSAITTGLLVTFGSNNVVDGVTCHSCGTGFSQSNGGVSNVFQNNFALACTTGFSIAQAAGAPNFLKNNHSSSTTDYTLTITPANVVMDGNTNAAGPVRSPSAAAAVAAATYTVGMVEETIHVNFAGTCTLTLPSASSVNNIGRRILVKTLTANAVNSASANVVPSVGGAATTGILAATAGKACWLVSDGTAWNIDLPN